MAKYPLEYRWTGGVPRAYSFPLYSGISTHKSLLYGLEHKLLEINNKSLKEAIQYLHRRIDEHKTLDKVLILTSYPFKPSIIKMSDNKYF